jgi:transcription initiation factor TFIID subunit 2
MSISSISINGQPAPFRMVDRQQPSSTIPSSSLSPQQAADMVSDIYQELSQDIEQSSDMFIDLPRIALLEGGGGSSEEHVVKISYAVTAPTDGILFWQDYAVTDNVGRRSSAWVPCVDDPLSNSTRFILRLTVPSHSMAIGPGTLEKQAWATKDKSWKTFQYMVGIPTSPSCLLFVIGPFTRVETDDDRLLLLVEPGKKEDREEEGKEEVEEGSERTKNQQQRAVMKTTINHFLPSKQTYNNETVDQTVQFFKLPFMLFEKILETEYPLANMQQVFVPPELLPAPALVGLGIQVLSTDSLINIHAIEQSTAARRSISMALAQQWFGVFVKPAAHDDAWLVEGLAGWLEDQYFKKYAGKNELQYRRWAEREAVCAADNGDAAPLIWVAERDTMPCPSEQLNPSDLRGLKCAAVVGMLERKAGEELFHRRVLALLTKSSSEGRDQQQHGSGTCDSSDGLFNAPVGDDFIVNLAKDGAFTKEAGAFKNRWVLECGVPHLVGAFMYHKRSSTLELALHQSGCEAARRAVDEAPESGVLRVLIKESVAPVEQTINIGSDAYLVNMIKVNPEIAKVPGRRGGRRKKLDPEAEAAAAAQRAAEQAAAQLPVQWVRLDPRGEWLSSTRMLQPEVMWSNQLHHSRDVIAQSEAVFGLSERRVNEVRRNPLIILEKALENTHMYCRVRADAATALGRIISDEGKPEGLDILLKYYRSRYWDGVFKPVAHSDPSEFIVAQAVIMAISKCKLKNSRSPFDAATFVMGYLDQWFSQGGYYDASELLATLCAGAGHLKLDADMDVVTDTIADKLLKLLESDIAFPSPGHCVGRACLGALVSLIVRRACSREQSSRIAATVRLCCETNGLPLRLAAFNGYFQLLSDGVAVLKGALDISRRDDMSPGLLTGIWQEAAQVCGSSSSGRGGGGVEGVVIDRLVKEVMMGTNVRIRHLVYMASQRLGGRPPTLVFRARVRSEKPIIKVMVPKEEGGEEKEGGGDEKAPVGTKFKIKL